MEATAVLSEGERFDLPLFRLELTTFLLFLFQDDLLPRTQDSGKILRSSPSDESSTSLTLKVSSNCLPRFLDASPSLTSLRSSASRNSHRDSTSARWKEELWSLDVRSEYRHRIGKSSCSRRNSGRLGRE